MPIKGSSVHRGPILRPLPSGSVVLLTAAWCAAAPHLHAQAPDEERLRDLASTVEIRRTDYGVPHILAGSLGGAAFGLAYAQAEDHGHPVFMGLIRARAQAASVEPSAESLQSDFRRTLTYERAQETWTDLNEDVREFMQGFADGLNYFLLRYPEESPGRREWEFTGVDVHAMQIGTWNAGLQRRFLEEVMGTGEMPPPEESSRTHPEDGSNAWAIAPSRATNGHAMLLRNPHLSWEAGYYEAHLRVPDLLDFYGDFRVGGLFGIIGGFNPWLGWSTTNNRPDLDEIYALDLIPGQSGRYRFDGASHYIDSQTVSVEVRWDDSVRTEYATFESTALGPVIHRTADKVYVMRSANDGEWRRPEQFLAMMQARSLDEWKDAMRMQAISASNYTYADRDGNIFYVWNAKLPVLPHENQDVRAVPARRSEDVWWELVAFDDLPQLLNPEGGYLRNENDPPFLTNLNVPLDPSRFTPSIPEPRLGLRSQHSLDLLHSDRTFTLEELVEAKHSPRMLLAERVKNDLVHAIGVSDTDEEIRAAARLLDQWDGTATPESRGSVLFEAWWRQYQLMADSTRWFKEPWTPARPVDTPRGLGATVEALQAFTLAVRETETRFGGWDVTWGEVHRLRIGSVDVPVTGCSGDLGCFRVLSFEKHADGKRTVERGDGWVLAVEFADTPRAYSVLAYGQSSRPGSPHRDDQAALFAANRMKPVAFTEADIDRTLLGRYHPGQEILR